MAYEILYHPKASSRDKVLAGAYIAAEVAARATPVVTAVVVGCIEFAPGCDDVVIAAGDAVINLADAAKGHEQAPEEGLPSPPAPTMPGPPSYPSAPPGSTGEYVSPYGYPNDPTKSPADGFNWEGREDSTPGSRQ